MFARGEFRNDAPIRHVGEDLREHHARQNLLAITDYRSRSFVAGTLNAQYERVGHDHFILTAAPALKTAGALGRRNSRSEHSPRLRHLSGGGVLWIPHLLAGMAVSTGFLVVAWIAIALLF